MCGIVGIINFNKTETSEVLLKQMRDTLTHRGPDDSGCHIDRNIGLAHRRLSILDLSKAGKQPMCNEDKKIWITFNGEIYNFFKLKKDLTAKGHIFKSDTDTEVIIHSYEEWGYDCVTRFNGMFSFALWDSRIKKLWLVRDRLGIKPLFYFSNNYLFSFASEIKALLVNPETSRNINNEALSYYLQLNWVPSNYTLFDNISQVLPGHYLIIDLNNNIKDIEYWKISPKYIYKSQSAWEEEFDELMFDSVNKRTISDVPFGAFLSGGMDSSSLSYWLSKSINNLKTYSIGFNEDSYNESKYSNLVYKKLKTDHKNFILSPNIIDVIQKIVYHSEEPTADSSMLALYYLAQNTSKEVRVVQSGDGADEILAGYETYQANIISGLYRKIPNLIKKDIIEPIIKNLPISNKKMSFEMKLKRFIASANLTSDEAHASWRLICDNSLKENILLNQKYNYNFLNIYKQYYSQSPFSTSLNRYLWIDTKLYLPGDMLVKVDRMTMAHSLEARVPFLDHRVVECCFNMPENLKLKNFLKKKYILKKIMKGRLPKEIINRKKAGFNLPIGLWIKNELKDFIFDHLTSKNSSFDNIIDQKTLINVLNKHLNNEFDYSHQIWGLLILKLWFKMFL